MERDPIDSKRVKRPGAPPRARRRLLRCVPAILAALLAAVFSAAAVQASEGTESPVAAATHAAVRSAQKAERQARKLAEQESRRAERAARLQAHREAQRNQREAIRLALKEKEGNTVAIECTGVTIAFTKFPAVPGSPNVVQESIAIKNPPASLGGGPISFPPITYSFEGSMSRQAIPIAFPVGHYLVDVHAKWASNGVHGDFDIHGNLTCPPAPNFVVRKLQTIAGSSQPPTESPLTATVGQTVDYTIVATNTGNTPLTFTTLSDPRCDPGTISGGSLAPVEPLGSVSFTCTHTLTAADRTAGAYTNVASLTAAPEAGEGPSKSKESNTVVVTPIDATPEEKAKEEQTKKEEEENAKKGKSSTPPPVSTPTVSVLGTTTGTTTVTKTAGKSGVLGFASATIPALHGPQGCVRGPFLASIKAAGVGAVSFYLDGHRLKTLTAKNARRGLLSVRIDASRLRIGVHHVLARITMKKASASARAAKAARSLTIVRCKSSVVTPHFTG
ncbi:MAG: DUF7507 domain-containing protein [Solirubrobacteraceae bacterium]